jgi:hypothetical protein
MRLVVVHYSSPVPRVWGIRLLGDGKGEKETAPEAQYSAEGGGSHPQGGRPFIACMMEHANAAKIVPTLWLPCDLLVALCLC